MAGRGLVAFTNTEADGRPRLDADAGEHFCAVQPNVGVALDDSPLQQPGTLHVTSKRLIWISDTDRHGYAVDFLSLSLHAISRDLEVYPLPCMYTQIETDDDLDYGDEEAADVLSDHQDTAVLSKVKEMRLVPSEPSVLDNLFRTLCDCALMNPDPVQDTEGEGDWVFNEEEVLAGVIGHSNGGQGHDVARFSEMHLNDDEQFDDAEESEEECIS